MEEQLSNSISITMGTCMGRLSTHSHTDFNLCQIELLQKMFQDLACRSKTQLVSKDTFQCFFNLNGLWAEEIFNTFDTEKKGELNFGEFLQGLGQLVKGCYEKQIYHLFKYYDIDKTNGIAYRQLLKMLYSYPKEELKNLFDDAQFLEAMKEPQRKYIFGGKEGLDPLREIIEECSSDEESRVASPKRTRRLSPIKTRDQRKICSSRCLENITYSTNNAQSLEDQSSPSGYKPAKENIWTPRPRRRQTTTLHSFPTKTEVRTIPTISLLVKKYAAYLFKEFNLDKDKDLINETQFRVLVSKHQKIFNSYFGGFHQYIWQVDHKLVPDYMKMTPWIETNCTVYNLKSATTSNKYLRFYRTTLFVFRTKKDSLPLRIVNLEGLIVQKYEREKSFGFLVTHRDGLYPQKAYLFSSSSLQDEWMIHLQGFMHNSLSQSYRVLDKIGSGNYSTVYKGTDKKTGLAVAIKSIEKFRFSLAEKDIIRQECGFFELVHHPSIASFVQKIETKTHMYIVTEFLGDGDLWEYISKRKHLCEYEAATIVHQLLSALEYLASLDIIHRDLKCENIMVKLTKEKDAVEKVKIIDFGFAVYKSVLEKLPQKEWFVGTPNYVAPQILKNQNFDEKVDMFSLGVIMYYMLSGELPFDSPFQEEINRMTMECDPLYQGRTWDGISSEGKDMLTKLLVEEKKRMSVGQALKHPWIKGREQFKNCGAKTRLNKYI